MNCEWLMQLDPRMIGRRLRQCDLVIGCSQYIASKIRETFPEFGGRCRVGYNGVDVKNFIPSDDRRERNEAKRLVYVSRVSPEKGLVSAAIFAVFLAYKDSLVGD